MKYTLKKILSVFLAIVMTVSVGGAAAGFLPKAAAAGSDIGDSVKVKDKGESLEIYGSGEMYDFPAGESPYANSSYSSVKIRDYVTTIGAYLFYQCRQLITVSFPSTTLRTIGDGAFQDCIHLRYITIPDTVTRIGSYAFEGCDDLTSIVIPGSVQDVESFAFDNCSGLTSVQISKNIKSIGNYAFSNCPDLTTVNYTGGPEDWKKLNVPASAFESTPATINYYRGVEGTENAISDIGANDGTDEYLARLATAHVFYNKLSDEDKQLVTNADELTAAKNAVPGYEFGICGDCVGYAWDKTAGKLVIGGSGDIKDYDTFSTNNLPPWYWNSLSSIVIGSGVTGIGNGAFYHFGGNPSVSLPEGLTKIGYRAFYFCEELQNIVLPESLTEIGEQAFYGCYSLKSMTIPDNVKKIGASTFCGCYSLVSFTIPENVKSIGISAFNECKALQTVTIHDGVTEIGESAFLNCPKLKTVNFTGSEAQWNAINKGKYIFDYYDYEAFEYYDRPAEEMPVFNFYYGVEGVANAINDIGTVEYTPECKARIDAAKAAYDKLSASEQAQLANANDLFAAEAEYARLEDEALHIPGDVNRDGQLDMADVLDIYYYLAHIGKLEIDVQNADVNGNSVIDGGDADMIQEYLTGQLDSLNGQKPDRPAGNNHAAANADPEIMCSFTDAERNTEVTVTAGEKTTIPVTLTLYGSSKKIYALDMQFKCSDGIRITGFIEDDNQNDFYTDNFAKTNGITRHATAFNIGGMSVTHGLKAFKLMVEVPDDAAAGSTYTVDFDELCQIFKYNYEGARDLFTTAVVPLTIKVAQPSSYTVQLTASANMTKTEGSGSASQTVSIGSAITDVVYTANNGYYFPENYAVESMNGLTVTRNSWTQITISGTPTANVTKTLKAPTEKSMPQMYISAPEVDHSLVADVRVYLPDDATGTVEISLDGANNSRTYHAVAIENGMAQITEQLPADTYAITATYGGNDKYTITGAISTLVVKKAMPDFTLKAEMSKDSNTAVITVTLPEDCTDPVDILIKDPTTREETITIGREKFSKGTATYEYTPAMAGKYLVSATYWGDDNYLPDISYINFINPMIVDVVGADYGKESTMTATLPDNATGTVTFSLEGKDSVETISYVVPVQNGKAQLNEMLPANETYKLTATYSGDGNYDDAVRTCSFVVGKAESSVTLEVMPVNLVYGETLTIIAYLEIDGEFVKDHIDPDTGNPANAPGSIYITVDGKEYYTVAVNPEDVLIELNGGTATLKVDGLDVGQHLIEAVFAGNSNYLECSEIIDITLEKATVQPPTAITGLTYNGEQQTGVNYDENLGYTLTEGTAQAVNAGPYTATFCVDSNHKWANTNSDTVEVPWSIDPATPEITLTATPKNDAKTEYDITFTIPADAVGAVTFTLTAPSGNEQICNVNSSYFVNGVYTIHVPEFGAFFKETGEYQIVVSYSNNSFYNNNYENVPDAATVKFKLGCDHVWNAPTWDWDDYEHPKYRAECSLCDDGEIEGQVASIPGERVEATHENDAYTPYTASVLLNNQTYTDTYNLVEKGSALQKCETDFNAYKNNLISAILERALDGDSDASTTIIDNAIEDVNSLPYDESKTYDQNIAAVDYEGVLGRLDEALADQRAADAVTRKINNIGDVTLTDESKEKIDAAREAYNDLTGDQKSLVKNYKTLTDAEAAYELLENTAAFNTQKETQQAEIDKLVSDGDSDQCKALIEKARKDIENASYDNGRTPEQNEEALKAIVTQLDADLKEHRAVHYAEFIADGKTLATIPYTIDTESIEAPEIPAKTGYTAKWPAYTLKAGGITVNAEYTLITYTATFKADGKVVGTVPFNINTTSISEPSVPKKNGYDGVWEAYTLGAKDITINAVYENITGIAIKDHKSKLEYKDNVTYEAIASDMPDGAEIHWFVNGEDTGTGESFTVEKPTDDYTIQAKVIGSNGTVFTESETETVFVKHTFWAKIFYYTMYKVYLLSKTVSKLLDIVIK